MKKIVKTILNLLIVIVFISCGGNSTENSNNNENNSNESDYYYEEELGYDGEYCAEVDYYNPNTGTRSTYTLNVEVEEGVLILIHWANGGWLDSDHFYPVELNEGGWCSFDSDKGYEFEVQITGPACSFTDEDYVSRDVRSDEDKITCSKCGNEKHRYDDYCSDCQYEIEHTCPRCGEYDTFIFSQGDLCSDCEEEEQNREEESDDYF